MIGIAIVTALVLFIAGVGIYQLRSYLNANREKDFWIGQGQMDAENKTPYDPPINTFSAQHYREGYYPLERPYR